MALRFTKPMAKAAGVTDGTRVRVSVKPGRIVIECETEPTLEQMLEAFDPKWHGGELMADGPVASSACSTREPSTKALCAPYSGCSAAPPCPDQPVAACPLQP